MTRTILHFLALLSAATLTISCGGAKTIQPTGATEEAAFVSLPAISHNDSLRFKIYYFEAIKQQTSGVAALPHHKPQRRRGLLHALFL